MLASKKIELRRSEIRQKLAELSAKPEPTEDELRSMSTLDTEYQQAEVRFRAAVIAEDIERREAGEELETRSDREYAELVAGFELRQIAAALDDGSALSGKTAEVVQEMRSHGSYRGLPVPLQVLEQRAGETIAADTPNPIQTRPTISRLFPSSVAAQMGVQLLTIDSGLMEYPVCTQGAVAGWGDGELANVGAAVEYETIDRPLQPNYNLGAQMVVSRRSSKQTGGALETSIRSDMNAVLSAALDKAVFLGTGANGQPTGLITGATAFGFTETDVSAAAGYSVFRSAATQFLVRSAAADYKAISLLIRHELVDDMDDTLYEAGSGVTEWDRVVAKFGRVVGTSNALAAPTGSPAKSSAVMMCSANGVPPAFLGVWGGFDMVRDVYTKAASGLLVLTAILTADVTASRAEQITILTGLQ